MSTTIKLHAGTKAALDALKENDETYDDLLRRALRIDERDAIEAAMRDGYAKRAGDDRALLDEWDKASEWPE
jgi:Arc/MetJ family transcription regulator